MSTITYTVTVASAKFLIDDAVAPKLTFRDGDTYVFDQADSTNSGHILQFSITSNNSGGAEYTTGVTKTGTPGSAGAKTTLITSTSTVDTIYYYSSGGGTYGEEFSNSGFNTSAKNLLKPIVGAEATAEKWGAMINHTIDQIDSITLSNPTITSFTYSDGASATAEKTVVGLVSVSCTTQTSTTVLVPGASLGIQVGMVVAGTGIPVGATVESIIIDTSFVLSVAATASATVTLTFGGAVIITGANFNSVLGGDLANIAVTFDGTSATSISVNALKTIITCTPPAHAAGTITLKITNDSGLAAETDFIYSAEAAWSATGALGSFMDGAYTNSGTVIRVQATEASDTITYAQTNSVGVVNTTGVQGLTLGTGLGSGANSAANAGYLTGTLSASEGTTYTFYATATDAENQITTPTLFNIISSYAGSGGTITTYTGFIVHTFVLGGDTTFTVNKAMNIDYLIVAGGGGGGVGGSSTYSAAGGGGAGGYQTASGLAVTAAGLTVTIGPGGASSANGSDSVFSSITVSGGGAGGDYNGQNGSNGGSGGGGAGGYPSSAGSGGTANAGYAGGGGIAASFPSGGGGGGAGTAGGTGVAGGQAGHGGEGQNVVMGLSAADSTLLLAAADDGSGDAGVVSGSYRYLAGGGGGGKWNESSGTNGSGGYGGGGAGNHTGVGTVGTAHTGGGGGAGWNGGGGAGGSGIVIIRYAV